MISRTFAARASAVITAANDAAGRAAAWILPLMMAVTLFVIAAAYFFNAGWVWVQESVTYMHGILFTAAAAHTLARDEHVRIDVFYARASRRGKALINLLGALFLLWPSCVFIAVKSFPYVSDSWSVWEGAFESGGIPASFALKTFILIFAILCMLQGLSIVINSVLTLTDGEKESENQTPATE